MVCWILSLVHSSSITSSTCLKECIIYPTLFSSVLYLRDLYHFSTSCLGLKSSKSSWSSFYPLTPTICQLLTRSTFLNSLAFLMLVKFISIFPHLPYLLVCNCFSYGLLQQPLNWFPGLQSCSLPTHSPQCYLSDLLKLEM